MSTPNLPHTENFAPLCDLVYQVQALVAESNAIKDSITNSIDKLALKTSGDELEDKEEKLKRLKAKNEELKKKLEAKSKHVKLITGLLNNYEVSIQAVLENIREDVLNYNFDLIKLNEVYQKQLSEASQKEYQEYENLIKKRVRIFEISEKLRELLKIVSDEFVFKNDNILHSTELSYLSSRLKVINNMSCLKQGS